MKHLTATRSLPANEIIFQQSPLLWGPSINSMPVCLGCGKAIDSQNSKPCQKCGWPVCSDLCEKSPSHLPECRYTVQRGEKVLIKDFGKPHSAYKCIMILRCLYHKQFLPKTWKKLEKYARITSTVCPRKEIQATAEFIRRFFKFFNTFTVEDIAKMYVFVMINSLEVTLTEPAYIAIFTIASRLKHSCKANCSTSFTNLGQIVISSATEIREGEDFTISYCNPLKSTPERRQYLNETRFFWCCCARCDDPTEFGTGFSGFKCQNIDCDGFLLPESFLNKQKLSEWVCKKCTQTMSSYLIYDIFERAINDQSNMRRNDIEECQNFLNNYSTYFHDTSCQLFHVQYSLCHLLGKEDIEKIAEDDLIFKFNLCKNLEHLIKIIAPTERKILATVLFEKGLSLLEISRRQKTDCAEVKEILEEAIQLQKFEPDALILVQEERARQILTHL